MKKRQIQERKNFAACAKFFLVVPLVLFGLERKIECKTSCTQKQEGETEERNEVERARTVFRDPYFFVDVRKCKKEINCHKRDDLRIETYHDQDSASNQAELKKRSKKSRCWVSVVHEIIRQENFVTDCPDKPEEKKCDHNSENCRN